MSRRPIEIMLLIEDNPGDARLIREMFREQGTQDVELEHVQCMEDAERFLALQAVDIILLDLGLPDVQGLDAVRRARKAAPGVPLVVLSGLDDESMAIQAMKEGAQDYLIKGQIEPRELVRALRYAVERKNIEESLYEEKERAQVTLDCIGDAVISTDVAGNIIFLNAVAEEMTGWRLTEVVGRPMTEALRIVNATTRRIVPNLMAKTAQQDRPGHLPFNTILIRRDGSEIFIEDSVAPIHNHDGQIVGSVKVFRDMSSARAMADQIAHAAEHDFLTGLPNHLLLNDRIGQAIALAQRNQDKVAVLFLDMDGFKHINDSLGHPAGDRLLQSIANRLRDCVRAPDTVSRQGGDEFIVLLQGVDEPEDAAVAAKRLLGSVAEAYSMGQHTLHMTTSIGVSLYPDDGPDAETLIKNADTAMYQAKENGRQSYQFFKPEMNVRAVERQSIEEDLRRALERNEFTLHYQPKIELATGTITGAEALLRWTHPTRGSVSPAQFIPIAEDSGLILSIGAWVLSEACAQAQSWMKAGVPVGTIAVNVSAIELRNESFLERLFSTLLESGLDPRSLELEVTESVLMKNSELAASILQNIREKGVRVAIDDFGTGYSSLSYLRKFPLDALKIDQSFVRDIAASPDDTAIVSAIISMGQSLKLRVVAEGVETVEDLAFLQHHECDEAQGYYFSRPVPAEHFVALLKSERSNQTYQAGNKVRASDAGNGRLDAPALPFDIENLKHRNLEILRHVAREGSSQPAEKC
jgi:diguanylate cyclase (GGDEF)-like protein/PAS domain S-box-containing protein